MPIYVDSDEEVDPNICWTAQAPGTDIFLQVSYVGSTSETINIDYHINLDKIPIIDLRETMDNAFHDAIPITPGEAYTGAYLGVTDTPSSHVYDYYRFNLDRPMVVTASVLDAGLPAEDGVRIFLMSPPEDSFGEVHGTARLATLVVELNRMAWDEHPFPAGEWRVLVTNAFGELNNYGEGSAPVCYKRPYRLVIMLTE